MVNRQPTEREYKLFRHLCDQTDTLCKQLQQATMSHTRSHDELDRLRRNMKTGTLPTDSNTVSNLQRAYKVSKSEISRISELLIEHRAFWARDTLMFDRELEQIFALPGIYSVRVRTETLTIRARLCIEYNDQLYDRGSWAITMQPAVKDIYNLQLRELRCGVQDWWSQGSYPDYRLSGQANFCFGPRTDELMLLVRTGQLLAAASLVINTMQSVNLEDQLDIPKAFKEVRPA